MSWNLDSKRPIYLQLMEHIQADILSGAYGLGDKLPSVRELAATASVNPNTMQKALTELERNQLVHSERTSGRFITTDQALITSLKKEIAQREITIFLEKLSNIGYTTCDVIELLKKRGEEDL